MNTHQMISQVNGENVVCCEKEGDCLRVLDAVGATACDVHVTGHEDESRIQSKLSEIFSRPIDPRREPTVTVQIDAQFDLLLQDHIRRCIYILSELFKSNTRLSVTFHFRRPPEDWSETTTSIERLREALQNNRQFTIRLSGPFDELDDQNLESMFRLGVQLRYVTGFANPDTHADSIVVNKAAITKITEFGFQVPMAFYVSRENIERIEESITEWLSVSHYGGFSIPLISNHPSYTFSKFDPPLPNAREYCQLLVRLYKKFSHFDMTLAPISELAFLAKRGGQNRALDLPTILPIHLNSAGTVGFYRQSPSQSIPWKTANEIAKLDQTALPALRQELRQFIKVVFDWERNSYCRECRWRGMCGGLDHFRKSNPLSGDVYDVMCNHRMLFLEHFVNERSADFTL